MTEAASDYEALKIGIQVVGYVGGWIAIVIGWRVSWAQNLKREERKELRELTDRLIELCHDVEHRSIDFLSSEPGGEDRQDQLHIRNDLSRLSRALSRLKTDSGFDCTAYMVAYRQAITGGAFDSSDRAALPLDSPDLTRIAVASLNLVDQMEAEYGRVAPRK
jgi:hypothetical protein